MRREEDFLSDRNTRLILELWLILRQFGKGLFFRLKERSRRPLVSRKALINAIERSLEVRLAQKMGRTNSKDLRIMMPETEDEAAKQLYTLLAICAGAFSSLSIGERGSFENTHPIKNLRQELFDLLFSVGKAEGLRRNPPIERWHSVIPWTEESRPLWDK